MGIAYISADTHLPSGEEGRGWPLLSWLSLSRFQLILQLAELDTDSSHTVSSQFDSRFRIESQTPVLFTDL